MGLFNFFCSYFFLGGGVIVGDFTGPGAGVLPGGGGTIPNFLITKAIKSSEGSLYNTKPVLVSNTYLYPFSFAT